MKPTKIEVPVFQTKAFQNSDTTWFFLITMGYPKESHTEIVIFQSSVNYSSKQYALEAAKKEIERLLEVTTKVCHDLIMGDEMPIPKHLH